MDLFHRHRWKLIDKAILPSGFEQMAKAGLTKVKAATCSVDMFKIAIVYVFQCSVCNKIKCKRV